VHFRWSLVVRPSLLSHILIFISDTIYVEDSLVNLLPKLFTTLAPVYRWFYWSRTLYEHSKFVCGRKSTTKTRGPRCQRDVFCVCTWTVYIKNQFHDLILYFPNKILSSYYANFVYDPYRFQYQMGPTPKTLEFLVRFRLYFCF
jgi:hypothetical protein